MYITVTLPTRQSVVLHHMYVTVTLPTCQSVVLHHMYVTVTLPTAVERHSVVSQLQ